MAAQTDAGTLALAGAARAVQLQVRAALLLDVAKLWPLLDAKRLDQTFPGWLQAMILLLRNYHGQSSAAAAAFYSKARAEAIGTPIRADLMKLADLPSEEWISEALGYSGPGMLTRDTARPGTALSTTLGTSARIALDGGRTTVEQTMHSDPRAVGYYRITDGQPCAFCALMASRGVVYKTELAAGREANKRFTGDGEFKYHNDCGCIAAPAFSDKQPLPALSNLAARIYDDHAAGERDQLAAFRKAWDAYQSAA